MRKTLVMVFMLCSTAAFAQTAAPAPQADDKPPPAQAKKDVAKPKEATTQPHSIAPSSIHRTHSRTRQSVPRQSLFLRKTAFPFIISADRLETI